MAESQEQIDLPFAGSYGLEDRVLEALLLSPSVDDASEALGMSNEDLLGFMDQHDIPADFRDQMVSMARYLMPDAQFQLLTNKIWSRTPRKNKRDQFTHAAKLAEEDDLVGGICDITADFITSGFKVYSADQTTQDDINAINRDINAEGIVKSLATNYARFDNMGLYTKFSGSSRSQKNFEFATSMEIPQLLVEPLNVYDKNKVPMKVAGQVIPKQFQDLYQYVKQNERRDKKLPKQIVQALNRLPQKYKDALKRGSSSAADNPQFGMFKQIGGNPFVYFDAMEGEFLDLYNYKGKTDRLVQPTMKRIFRFTALRDLIADGDFTIYTFIKFLIHQVKVGDPEANRSNNFIASLKSGTPSTETLKKLKKQYENFERVMQEFTGPHHEHEFVHPPIELVKGEKYEYPEKAILNWGGVRVFLSMEGNSYSVAYLYTKGIQMKVKHAREHGIGRLLERAIYRPILGDDADFTIHWNRDVFKENKQVFEELIGKYGAGLIDPITASERLGEDPEVTKQRIKEIRENNEEQFFWPIFEQKQGIIKMFMSDKFGWGDDGQMPNSDDGDPGNPPQSQEPFPDVQRQPRPSEAQKTFQHIMASWLMNELGTVKKKDGKWYVYDKDGTKQLDGPFDSKKEAEERLREIEYFAEQNSGE